MAAPGSAGTPRPGGTPLEVILVRPVFVSQLVVAVLGVMVISAEYTTG